MKLFVKILRTRVTNFTIMNVHAEYRSLAIRNKFEKSATAKLVEIAHLISAASRSA